MAAKTVAVRQSAPRYGVAAYATVGLWAAALAAATWPAAEAAAQGRGVIPLAEGWRFSWGDRDDGPSPTLDDRSWETVRVPHDAAIRGPFEERHPASREGGFLPTGVAWYRRQFPLEESLRGRRILLELDGVMANGAVWLNGQLVGRRPGGYASVSYDATHAARCGEKSDGENLLAVRVDTSQQVASRWYAGTGVTRAVRVVAVDPLRFEVGGVFATTTSCTAEEATLHIAYEVRNDRPAATTATLASQLFDPVGAVVAERRTDLQVAAGGDRRGDASSSAATHELSVSRPRRWDVDDPNLYELRSQIVEGDRVVDEIRTVVGLRAAEFRADTGFWLNGRNRKLQGVCLHHDGGAFGAAVPRSVWRERLRRLQALGVNAIRTAHNPPDPQLLELCDELGLLVMDEAFDCWRVGKRKHDYHRHFDEWAERDLADMIRRDRNHPSIVLYSVGNEIHDTPRTDAAQEVLGRLLAVCRRLDPTRPVTQALFRPNVSRDFDNGLADMLDVIGVNYRDLELLDAWRAKPTRRIVGTEQTHDRAIWLACRDNPPHAGQFLWTGIDYLGESPRWPITTFDAGLLDRTGRVTPRGRQRQSWWSDEPMVAAFRREGADAPTPPDPGYEQVEWDRRQRLYPDWSPFASSPHDEVVEVYSNCAAVELSLNGRSLGAKPLPADAAPRTWRVPFEPGVLAAVGRNAEDHEVARDELRTAGPPHAIRLALNGERLPAAWDEVAFVEATIVDPAGIPVPRAAHEVTFAVAGAGEVAAVDNGSIVSHEPFQASRRRAFHGRCTAWIRAIGAGESITVTATAPGLAAGQATFEVAGTR